MGVSTEDGRGNITAYAGVRDNKKVLQRDRDYSACSLNANPTVSFACGGSATSFPGYFYVVPVRPAMLSPIDAGDAAIRSGRSMTNTDLYNFGPTNHYQRPDTRYTLGAMGHYELARVRGRLHAVDVHGLRVGRPDRSGRQLLRHQHDQLRQPAAVRTAAGNHRLRCRGDCGWRRALTLYIARRNVEGGGRQQRFENTSFRALLGCSRRRSPRTGTTTPRCSTRRSSPTSRPTTTSTRRAWRARWTSIDDPRHRRNARRAASVLDGTDPNCVPYNPFPIGGVTPEALELPAGARPAAGQDRAGGLQRIGDR